MSDSFSPYALDTNAYALLFGDQSSGTLSLLKGRLDQGSGISFHLPEIVAMEIHSVIGKYRRGGSPEGHEPCTRNIVISNGMMKCQNTCYNQPRARMKSKIFKALQKLFDDIEAGRGSMRAKMLSIGPQEISQGKKLLARYAGQYSFGSHDALVAGTVVAARELGHELTLVTSDKGLKAVATEVGIPLFDPNAP